MDKLYTISEVAKLLKVSRVSIYTWIEEGKLNVLTLPNDTKRITETEVKRILGGN